MLKLFKVTIIFALAVAAHAQIDPTIPLRGKTPVVQDPMETYRRAQEIRNLQLQNEQIRLQNEAMIRARETTQTPSPVSAPIRPSLLGADFREIRTHGVLNCRAWKGSSEPVRTVYIVAGIEMLSSVVTDLAKEPDKLKGLFEKYLPYGLSVDETTVGTNQLCGLPENAALPILSVLKVLSLKTRGGKPQEIEEALALDRKVASTVMDSEKSPSAAAPLENLEKPSGYPTLWKSLSSGLVRKLRFDGDFIYGETVSSGAAANPEFVSYELKREKDGYRGTVRSDWKCEYPAPALTWDYGSMRQNRCKFEEQIEFTSVTPNRIEGRTFEPVAGGKFDCKKCSYSKKSMPASFTWIPE